MNYSKAPNQFGKDYFWFERTEKGILPYCHEKSEEEINEVCSKTGHGECCAAKIMNDGWEIKDDYPW